MKKILLFLGTLLSTVVSYSQTLTANFTRLSGAMNVHGFLYPSSKILSYNHYLNTVCFIHRKSPTYVTSPSLPANAQSGAIVADIGQAAGTVWDSTLVYANSTNWGRFPQGGLYSPAGNSNINNAYVVATGVTNDAAISLIGSFYASKTLTSTAQKNAAGPDQQYMAPTAPFGSSTSPNMRKHFYPRYSFSSAANGMISSLGALYDTTNGNSLPEKFRGAMLAKGSFNSGVFVWTADSMIPPTIMKSNGYKQIFETPYMAWDENGNVGYVVMIGARLGSIGNYKGMQPLVYKTTNAGNAWILVNGINFNTPGAYDFILNSLDPVNSNTNQIIPMFNPNDGIDVAVDRNGKLHIFTTVKSTKSSHNDSLAYEHQYVIGQDTGFHWKFTNNKWPYLLDFSGWGGSNWLCKTIDSVGTQERTPPSPSTSTVNFPWYTYTLPLGPDTKFDTYMRLQMSRTYDGEFIVYSWAESDTTLTTNQKKWNEFPNIKARALRVPDITLSQQEFVVSSPTTGFNPGVKDKAYFHHISATTPGNCVGLTGATFTVPITVSNNSVTDGAGPVDNFYANASMQFTFPPITVWNYNCTVNTEEQGRQELQLNIFPNPSSGKFEISLKLDSSHNIAIEVYNVVGQGLEKIFYTGSTGANIISLDLKNCKPGIYFVKVKAGNAESIKKLIIE
jgi:hypothetical protein